MSERPFCLTFDNGDARAMADRGDLEGSTFPPLARRTFSTVSAARARARNLLVEQYDPRVPFEKQPHAVVHGPGIREDYVHLPHGEIKTIDEITELDLTLSDLGLTPADVARIVRDQGMRESLRSAIAVWTVFDTMAHTF